jgi:hypothetical protein
MPRFNRGIVLLVRSGVDGWCPDCSPAALLNLLI